MMRRRRRICPKFWNPLYDDFYIQFDKEVWYRLREGTRGPLLTDVWASVAEKVIASIRGKNEKT